MSKQLLKAAVLSGIRETRTELTDVSRRKHPGNSCKGARRAGKHLDNSCKGAR